MASLEAQNAKVVMWGLDSGEEHTFSPPGLAVANLFYGPANTLHFEDRSDAWFTELVQINGNQLCPGVQIFLY